MTRRAWWGAAACACLLLARPSAARDKKLEAPRLDPDVTGEGQAQPSSKSAAWVAPPPMTIDIPDKCAASIRKACPSAFRGVRELRACLKTSAARIPRSCRGAVEAQLSGAAGPTGASGAAAVHAAAGRAPLTRRPATVKQARAMVLHDCKPDAQEFCSDLVKPDEADMVSCLKAYADQSSAPCAAALSDLVKLEGD